MDQLPFIFDDGGRAEAGYRGSAGDCVVRAIAIATGKPYSEVYDDLWELNRVRRQTKRAPKSRSPRNGGTTTRTIRSYLESLGWTWVPTMTIGSGTTTHLTPDELPGGRIIARVSKHLCAVIDGVIHDTHDPSRDGTRCVYGYYHKE
jgi:hypothetical protein